MTPITQNLMPMGRVAEQAAGPQGSILPPMPSGAAPAPSPAALPPPTGAPPPIQSFPAPGAPSAPPYDVKLQPDGSSIYVIESPNGPIVLGVNQPPKLPKALQQPTA